jgi:hypothetical protein
MATQPEKVKLIRTWGNFTELHPKTSLNSVLRHCGMKLEHKERFLGVSRHFVVMSKVALLVAIFGVTSLLSHATKRSEFLLPMV